VQGALAGASARGRVPGAECRGGASPGVRTPTPPLSSPTARTLRPGFSSPPGSGAPSAGVGREAGRAGRLLLFIPSGVQALGLRLGKAGLYYLSGCKDKGLCHNFSPSIFESELSEGRTERAANAEWPIEGNPAL
jgi:hypothetical protein